MHIENTISVSETNWIRSSKNNSQVQRSEAAILEYADFLGSNITAIDMCRCRSFPTFWFTNVYGYRWLPVFGPQMFSDVNVCRCICLRLTDAYDTYGENIYMLCETLTKTHRAVDHMGISNQLKLG